MLKSSVSQPIFIDQNRLKNIQQIIPKIDQIYKEYASKSNIPGYCYTIVVDGKLIHTQAGGYADVAKKIPATPRTVFRLASLSKSFTAMAILQLRDAGKLRLDDPVHLYMPEISNQQLTNDSPQICIRDLLTHAAGLPQDDPWGDRKLSDTTDEFLTMLKKGTCFSNATGIKYEYSNLGYTILGHIISKVSGMPLHSVICGRKSITFCSCFVAKHFPHTLLLKESITISNQ